MPTIFFSYSTQDHIFAELAGLKLAEAGITLWRDQGQLRAGSDWRTGIERGIADSIAVLVALSQDAADSPYVTFEWAYGLGKGKTVVPLKLDNCKVHPRLEPIQHLDFSVPGSLPWNLLIERVREIEADATSQEDLKMAGAAMAPVPDNKTVKSILGYLDQRGYQMVSFDRIRDKIDSSLTDSKLEALVQGHSLIFRPAQLKEGKKGLKKVIP